MPIGHFWRGLPGDIDAAYERHDGRFVFFKGEQGSWSLGGGAGGAPTSWPDRAQLGNAASPAFSISSHSGNRYWLFREANLEAGYPQPLSTYGQGIPYDSIDTAVWWEPTGHTFFFRGDRWVLLFPGLEWGQHGVRGGGMISCWQMAFSTED